MSDLFGSDGSFNFGEALDRAFSPNGEEYLAPLAWPSSPGPTLGSYSLPTSTTPSLGFGSNLIPQTSRGWLAAALLAFLVYFLLVR